jgi:hypothetical protein
MWRLRLKGIGFALLIIYLSMEWTLGLLTIWRGW